MAFYLKFTDQTNAGTEYTYANTISELETATTFRIEIDSFKWLRSGYAFSQAGASGANRVISWWANSSAEGIQSHVLGTSTEIMTAVEADAAFPAGIGDPNVNMAYEVNLSTGAYQIEADGVVVKTGTQAVGTSPYWGGKFRFGARGDTDVVTDTGGAFIAGFALNIGETRIFIDGTRVRRYSSDGTGSTYEELDQSAPATLVNFPTDDSQWVAYTPPAPAVQTIRKASNFEIETTLGSITTATLNTVDVFNHVSGQVGTTVSFAGAATDEITTSGEYSLVLGDGVGTETITAQVNVVGVTPSNNPVQKDGAVLASLTGVQVRVTNGTALNGAQRYYTTTATTDASGNLSNIDLSDTVAAIDDPVRLQILTAAGDSINAIETAGLI